MLADWAGVPLGWMLGPAFVGLLLAALNNPIGSDGPLGNWGRGLLGASVGGMLQSEHLLILINAPELLLVTGGYVFAAGFVGWLWLTRVCGWQSQSGWYAALPGGLSEMVELTRQAGGRAYEVALAHTLRIFLLLSLAALAVAFVHEGSWSGFALPPLALSDALMLFAVVWVGLVVGKRIQLPAHSVMGPLLISALLSFVLDWHLSVNEPLVIVAQLAIGWSLAHRFQGSSFPQIRSGLWQITGMLLCLIPLWVLAAWVVMILTEHSLAVMLLAFAPGGQAEMALIALLLGASPALVVTLHVLRVVLILSFASRWYPGKNR